MARGKNKLSSSKALQSLLIQFQTRKSLVMSDSNDTCANVIALKERRMYFHFYFCGILLKT